MTVTELNQIISDAIRSDPRTRSLAVRGEVSGFKHHIASGHWYFNLKDENASVSCVMFRQSNIRAPFRPQDGDRIQIGGYADVYPRDGKYQLYVQNIRKAGLGDLYLRFEELKRKLNAEGLFDPARKRTLPMVPKQVAVVTSESGAALRDILNVSGNRCPFIPITVVPATVQGASAAASICEGIRKANELPDTDVIIVARGGGSVEDLWCFNEESVARAVATSRVPVVSGVGHEIDFTLCDYAADVRASTPSNAAEIVFPDRSELRGRVTVLRTALLKEMSGRVNAGLLRIHGVRKNLEALSPENRLENLLQHTRISRSELSSSIQKRITSVENDLSALSTMLNWQMDRIMAEKDAMIGQVRIGLRAVSPLSVLDRGYAIVRSENGRIVSSASEARNETVLEITFRDGKVKTAREESEHE